MWHRYKNIVNTYYNLSDLLAFSKEIRKAIFFHPKMFKSMLDPKHKGIRTWEYGMLLTMVRFSKNSKVLDIGSGSSALPFYLANKGLKVTAFDLAKPLEPPNTDLLRRYPHVTYDHGDMLHLPYKNNYFDKVLCITTIEHLDYDFDKGKPIPYRLFLKRAKRAVREMIRVLKKGGKLYITSDLYFPDKQTYDRYPQAYFYKGIGAAFKKDDFDDVFLQTLKKSGCRLVGPSDYNWNDLLSNVNRANFRGRYFTTFAVYAEKT